MNIADRLVRLRQSLVEKELDGVLISQWQDRQYLSGFNGSAGYLFITKDKTVLATDFRYVEQAGMQAPGYEILKITGGFAEWLPALLSGFNIQKQGFESDHFTVAIFQQLKEAVAKLSPAISLVPVENMVEMLRGIKEPAEIELVARAAQIVDSAFSHAANIARAGMTELALAWEIEKFMRESGSEAVPFEAIVASGPNGALPHARPSSRPIAEGEPIVIDIGASVEGYASDQTRTICLGVPGDKLKKVYDVVLGAQLTAVATIKAGMTGQQADSQARTVIEEAGYADAFGHSLGHGVGLAVHEFPRLGPKSTDVLTDNMVFTIEPGIYLPGWGGVRIEDMVTLEGGKVRTISKAPKDMR